MSIPVKADELKTKFSPVGRPRGKKFSIEEQFTLKLKNALEEFKFSEETINTLIERTKDIPNYLFLNVKLLSVSFYIFSLYVERYEDYQDEEINYQYLNELINKNIGRIAIIGKREDYEQDIIRYFFAILESLRKS